MKSVRNGNKTEEIIVVMASRRRAMKKLCRVTFSPDTTSGGGSPRVGENYMHIYIYDDSKDESERD